jgi:hypothetical protein
LEEQEILEAVGLRLCLRIPIGFVEYVGYACVPIVLNFEELVVALNQRVILNGSEIPELGLAQAEPDPCVAPEP